MTGTLRLDGEGLNQLTGGLDNHQTAIGDEAPAAERAADAAAGKLRSARPHRSAADLSHAFGHQATQISDYAASVVASLRDAQQAIADTDARLGAALDAGATR